MPSYYDEYSADEARYNRDEAYVIFPPPNFDQGAGVSPVFPVDTLATPNIDVGDISLPPTNSNPTFYVDVYAPKPVEPAPASDSAIPWWVWLLGGYAAWRLLQ